MDADNQKIQAPFGDVYIPDTSATDKLSQQLNVQNTQNRKLQLAQQNLLDKEFSKELGLIKNVDIPKFTKLYQDYATLSKSYSNQPYTTPEQQQQLNQAKSNAFSIANASIENKKEIELEKKKMSDPKMQYYYSQDANDKIVKALSTPTDELDPNWKDSLLDKNYNNYDISKLFKTAIGDDNKENIINVVPPEPKFDANGKPNPKYDPSNFSSTNTMVKRGNDPDTYANFIVSEIVSDSKKTAKFVQAMDLMADPTGIAGGLTPQKLNETVSLYNDALNDPKKAKIMGNPSPINIGNVTDPVNQALMFAKAERGLHILNTAIPYTKDIVDNNAKALWENDQKKTAAALLEQNKIKNMDYAIKNGIIKQVQQHPSQDYYAGLINTTNKVSGNEIPGVTTPQFVRTPLKNANSVQAEVIRDKIKQTLNTESKKNYDDSKVYYEIGDNGDVIPIVQAGKTKSPNDTKFSAIPQIDFNILSNKLATGVGGANSSMINNTIKSSLKASDWKKNNKKK